ncbi:MAG: hypothetical protein ACLFQV_06725 [Vulcanimicrobiota bacterium]
MPVETAKMKLERILSKLDKGEIRELSRHEDYVPTGLGEHEDMTLPTIQSVYRGKKMVIEFVTYHEGGYLFNIQLTIPSPFKLVLSFEDSEIKSRKFGASSPIPVTEIEIGIKEFDDMYFIETLEEEVTRTFLSKTKVRELIESLERFDHLTFDYRYLKLEYYVKDVQEINEDWVFNKIEIMDLLADLLIQYNKEN